MEYRVHSFDELESTNDTAAISSYKHLDVVVAKFQTLGRGQRGNRWISKGGENLMFSLVLEPRDIMVNQQFLLSMMAAVAVRRTVESFGVENVEVKWPNDIMVAEKKVSGILIEHFFSSQYLSRTIIGVGLNVGQREFEKDAGNPTSLALLGVEDAEVEDVLTRFLGEFDSTYTLAEDELMQEYLENLYRRDGEHLFADKEGEFMAKMDSINPYSGELSLRISETGELRSYYFKEVSYL